MLTLTRFNILQVNSCNEHLSHFVLVFLMLALNLNKKQNKNNILKKGPLVRNFRLWINLEYSVISLFLNWLYPSGHLPAKS